MALNVAKLFETHDAVLEWDDESYPSQPPQPNWFGRMVAGMVDEFGDPLMTLPI